MKNPSLSFQARKALQVQIGEPAGNEIAELLIHLSSRIEQLERSKVNVTRVVPETPTRDHHEQRRRSRAA